MSFEETHNAPTTQPRNPALPSSPKPKPLNSRFSTSQLPSLNRPSSILNPSRVQPAAPPNSCRAAPRAEKEPTMEDFATALETFEQEQAQTEAALNEEQIVTGTVLKITRAIRRRRYRLQVRRRGSRRGIPGP